MHDLTCVFPPSFSVFPLKAKAEKEDGGLAAWLLISYDILLLSLGEVTLAIMNPYPCLGTNFIPPYYCFISMGWLLADFFLSLFFFPLKFLTETNPVFSEYLKV